MSRSLLIFGSFLAALCLTPQAWSGDVTSPAPLGQRWASWFSPQETQTGSTSVQPREEFVQTAVTSNVLFPPVPPPRLRDLSPETERPRVAQLLATSTWFKGKLATETEIAQSQGGAAWLSQSIPGSSRIDPSTRMVRLGLTGTEGSVRYGLTFRSAGQGFLIAPDQAGREVWTEWKSGLVTLRTAVGQLWNNVAAETNRARLEQTYGKTGVVFNKPSWPELSLTYSRNSLNSALEPPGIAPMRSVNHTLEGALALQRSRWNVRLASSYVMASDVLHSGAESNVRLQTLSAIFRPLDTLTITPVFVYREEFQEWSCVRIDNPSASLAFIYQQSHRLLVSAVGNYASARSSDRLIDTENLGGRGVLTWAIQTSPTWNAKIAFEAGYNRLTNRAAPSADTEDISGLLRLVLASL